MASRFAFACAAGAVAAGIVFVFVFVSSAQTFRIFDTPIVPVGPPHNFYDAQASALLDGHLDVPRSAIGSETIAIDGKYYGYFGLAPALLRVPILLVAPGAAGHLNPFFLLAAFATTMYFSSRLIWDARRLFRRDAAVSRVEAAAVALFVFVLGAGTTTVFLATYIQPHHEGILWGVAWSIATLSFSLRFLLSPSRLGPLWMGLTAGLALLSRPTLGLVALATVGLVVLVAFAAWLSRADEPVGPRRVRRLVDRIPSLAGAPEPKRLGIALPPLLAALFLPVAVYAIINYAKFGSLFGVPFDHHVAWVKDPARLARLRSWGLFNPKFIVGDAVQYLRPDGLGLSSRFPWLVFRFSTTSWARAAPAFNPFNVQNDGVEPHSSITATMPALVMLTVVGLTATFQRRPKWTTSAARLAVIGATVGPIATFCFAGLTHRYLGDFIPFLTLCSALGLYAMATWRRALKLAFATVLVVAGTFSVFVNVGLAIDYQHIFPGAPPSVQRAYRDFQANLAGLFERRRHARTRVTDIW